MADRVKERGLVLLGCGKMGSAMLEGWLAQGVPPGAVWVLDPHPSDWLKATGVHLNAGMPAAPAIVLLAVKPQMMGAALPQVAALGNGETLFLSVAAGTTIASFESAFGAATPIIRAMPNTPAAVGRGITAITGNARASESDMALAETLLSAVGEVVRLEGELAHRAPESAAQLRINVTSPGGTTAAALAVLMDAETGFPPLLRRAVKAAADRGRELGR